MNCVEVITTWPISIVSGAFEQTRRKKKGRGGGGGHSGELRREGGRRF